MAILGIRDNPNDLCHRSVLCLASLATSPTERASLEEGKGKGASFRRDGYEHIYFARANGLRRGVYTQLAGFAAEISSITANMANKTNDSNKSNGNNLLLAVNVIPLNNTRFLFLFLQAYKINSRSVSPTSFTVSPPESTNFISPSSMHWRVKVTGHKPYGLNSSGSFSCILCVQVKSIILM